jgi:hypothetical protein
MSDAEPSIFHSSALASPFKLTWIRGERNELKETRCIGRADHDSSSSNEAFVSARCSVEIERARNGKIVIVTPTAWVGRLRLL